MESHSEQVRKVVPRRKLSEDTTRTSYRPLEEAVMHVHLTATDMKVNNAISLSGKYSKQVLSRLEETGSLTPAVRKAVLDGFNDYRRELERVFSQ